MDEIRKFTFEGLGCEHFLLLVYVSCVLTPFPGNKLTITTDSNHSTSHKLRLLQHFHHCCHLLLDSHRLVG